MNTPKIEAVTVSTNYTDFLEHCIVQNQSQLDGWVIVTDHNDKKTQRLCNEHGLKCVPTNVLTDQGDEFNKGRAINVGLSHLKNDGWLLHLDSDIVLPNRFRHLMTHAMLDPANLYGVDRVNCQDANDWQANKHNHLRQFRKHYLVSVGLPLGSRLVHNDYGYCPIGFFQLWHSSQKKNYPTNQGSAEHTDVLFAMQFPRKNRILLPEIIVIHLDNSKFQGQNWKGRQSPEFTTGKAEFREGQS